MTALHTRLCHTDICDRTQIAHTPPVPPPTRAQLTPVPPLPTPSLSDSPRDDRHLPTDTTAKQDTPVTCWRELCSSVKLFT